MIFYSQPFRIELLGTTLIANSKTIHPIVRTFSELKDVLNEEPVSEGDAYYMYREIIKKDGLRYDITVIPVWEKEKEMSKTYGHCHPIAEKNLSYPEVYQILSGTAIFILQKELSNGGFFVSIVEGKKGDILLIPPNFCHTTINSSKDMLVLSNIVADDFTSDYSMFKKNHGAAYYVTPDGGFLHNPYYIISQNERVKTNDINKRYGFECKDILLEFVANPQKFEFLKKPSLLKLNNTYL
ncbi:MAG: glucose-6-phosphate isomerase family protein [Candidatus Bilamarchaeaceae archaeon]